MNQLDYEANAVNLQILFIAFNSNRTKLFKNWQFTPFILKRFMRHCNRKTSIEYIRKIKQKWDDVAVSVAM